MISMSIPMIIFAIILLICSVALVAVVALQSNRGSEMAALTGRNNNASGKGQTAKKEGLLRRLTVVFGLIFVVCVFVMNIVVSTGI